MDGPRMKMKAVPPAATSVAVAATTMTAADLPGRARPRRLGWLLAVIALPLSGAGPA
jgi:hypothetical protein